MAEDFHLDLPGLIETGCEHYPDEGFVLFTAVPERKGTLNPECPVCHSRDKVWKNGTTHIEVVDGRHFDDRVRIDIELPRYICNNPDCKDKKRNFQEDLSNIIDTKHRITLRLRKLIMEMCAQRVSFSYIADYFGLDEETVAAVFYEQAEIYMQNRDIELPRYIGVDEVHLAQDMRFVLYNVEEGQVRVLDMIDKRTQPKVEDFFGSFPEEQREKVECVTMDMWR